jgi:predicted XRE-type DNA-binding protein
MLNTKEIQYYVDDNGCWICISHCKNKHGYPMVARNRTPMHLVRAIAKEKYPDLPTYIHVLHKCNNTFCINPQHLYLGTNADNMKDRKDSGHYASTEGENNNNAKISKEIVDIIRELYKTNTTTHRKLARLFGISKTQVTRILNNKQWKDGE